jgi:hypothetical protein
LVVGFEIGHESIELCGVFAFDQDPAGSESVFEGVFAGCGLAGLSARTAFGLIFGFAFGVKRVGVKRVGVKRVGVKGLAHMGFPDMRIAGRFWV